MSKEKVFLTIGAVMASFAAGMSVANKVNSTDKMVKKWKNLAYQYHNEIIEVRIENFALKNEIREGKV